MTIIAALLAAEHELAFLHGSTADDGCRTWSIDHAKTLALIADALSAIGVIRDPVVTVRLVETALRVSPRVEDAALTDCGAARGDSANRSPYQPSMTLIDREMVPITAALADLERRAKFVLDALLSAEHDLSFFHGLIATDCVEGPLSEKAVFFEIETRDTLKKLEAAIREFCGRDTGVGCDL